MPCMHNDIICGPHSFVTRTLLYLHRSEQGNSGRMYYNECQSRVLRGILFLVLLRNMDYEWGRDQTCCGFNMYDSFHMHQAHSRCEPASTSDTREKEPNILEFFVACLARLCVFHYAIIHCRDNVFSWYSRAVLVNHRQSQICFCNILSIFHLGHGSSVVSSLVV